MLRIPEYGLYCSCSATLAVDCLSPGMLDLRECYMYVLLWICYILLSM